MNRTPKTRYNFPRSYKKPRPGKKPGRGLLCLPGKPFPVIWPHQPTVTALCLIGRTHSVFSRTSGRDTPTAFSKKANCDEFVFHSTGKALQKKAKKLLKTGSHRSASHLKKKSMEYGKGSNPGNTQAWSLTVIGKNPSLLSCHFRLFNRYSAMDAWRPSTKAFSQS